MRTYDLARWDANDDEKIVIQIEPTYLEVIVAALQHCARGSHQNILRETNHSMSSLYYLRNEFEGMLHDERSQPAKIEETK